MKILVFEYITGGGYSELHLTGSLLLEAELMLAGLLGDLTEIPGITVSILRDNRLPMPEMLRTSDNMISVDPGQDLNTIFVQTLKQVDAVWVIAPETEGILLNWCEKVLQWGKVLLNCRTEALRLTADKLATIRLLENASIPVVQSRSLDAISCIEPGDWVIKPRDGVGCDECVLVQGQLSPQRLAIPWQQRNRYIVQPYVSGNSISMSCLFKSGHAVTICCNRQHTVVLQGKFQLQACRVNSRQFTAENLQQLVESIAKVIPDLWGYVGIDLIATQNQLLVLEINPRLTTSYAGIKSALGINVAAEVLRLLHHNPRPIAADIDKEVLVNVIEGVSL